MKIPLGYVIVLVYLGLKGFAQPTHTLAAVEIHAHVKVLDTLDLTTSNANNLTQMLMLQPGLLLRNYGPGASAAIAVRGGSTGQTQVYWHDFSVQHPMLGITDASALPVFLFDRVEIQRNAAQSIQAARPGFSSVHLDAQPLNFSELKNAVYFTGSSLKNIDLGFKSRYQFSKLKLTSKAYYKNCQNAYFWLPVSQLLTGLNHAAEDQLHVMQDVIYNIAPTQTVELHAWAQNLLRQISFTPEQAVNKTGIQQQSLKVVGNWKGLFNKLQCSAMLGYSTETFKYTDSMSMYNSLHQSQCFQHHIQSQLQLTALQLVKAGFVGNFNQAQSTSYSQIGIQYQPLVWVSHTFSKNSVGIETIGRLEWTQTKAAPMSILEQLFYSGNSIMCKASFGRQFRWPSLNERYWQPGGNINLEPEVSVGGDIYCKVVHSINKLTLELTQSAFIKNIQNWITWLPGAAAQAQVVNIEAVHNRGLETEITVHRNWNTIELIVAAQWNCAYTFTLANPKPFSIEATGLQWIYTPMYTGSGKLQCNSPFLTFQWQVMYTGYSYTSSDHHSWISPFWLHHLTLIRKQRMGKNYQINYSLQCDNLFDTPNQWIAGKPLPGRQFIFSTQFNF